MLSWYPKGGDSPAIGMYKPKAPPAAGDRVLTEAEIKWLWQACDTLGEPFASLLKLLTLTGCRRGSMRCDCGRCVVRPPCHDGCRLSRIKAPFTLARERDSMGHTKLQSQAWPSTTRNWMMMRKGVPLRAHSCPYLSLDRSRLRFFVENRNGQLGRLCCLAP
jgi:hypothetical protein